MPITLVQLIREARARLDGMTQAELARLIGCSTENVTSIENGRNRQPSPTLINNMARVLDIGVEDIYAAIAGTLNHMPWEKSGDLDLRDPELGLMFRQMDDMPDGEPKERVKAFIRFTLEEERRRKHREVQKEREREKQIS
ncbi:MAG: hypothetical protein COS88_03640 [Chloroflexi bacterium CG07_land_8_20_14_0_80_51_10]|nr:MAG: hypothetical protein COS88_03640 [Chloroflexi bacterium CG07_land_8_20_14_0_80_51_10]